MIRQQWKSLAIAKTAQRRIEIIKLRKAGVKFSEIARILGLSFRRITQIYEVTEECRIEKSKPRRPVRLRRFKDPSTAFAKLIIPTPTILKPHHLAFYRQQIVYVVVKNDVVVYVGRSKLVINRILSDPSHPARRLIDRCDEIRLYRCSSDKHAALLEAKFINTYKPRLNFNGKGHARVINGIDFRKNKIKCYLS